MIVHAQFVTLPNSTQRTQASRLGVEHPGLCLIGLGSLLKNG